MTKGYKYRQEAGTIIGDNNTIISLISGNLGSVDFPEELIWDIHQKRPGYIFKLAHTHPPTMSNLSGRDKQTLKTWTFALYPFPIRMSTVTQIEDFTFLETTYLGYLEPRESWKQRGGKRGFEIIIENQEEFFCDVDTTWRPILVNKSYEEPFI